MATTTTTVSGQQTIPEILEPYFIGAGKPGEAGYVPGLLPTAQGVYSADYATRYQPLQQAGLLGTGRVAGLSPTQQALGQQITGMGTPTQFGEAGQYVGQAATGLAGLLGLQAPSVSAPSLSAYEMAPTALVSAPSLQQYGMEAVQAGYTPSTVSPEMRAAQTGFAPNLQQYQMGPAQQVASQGVTSKDIQAAQTGYAPQLTTFQMAAPESFGLEQAQRYMSPYMQSVTDVAKRQASEDARRAQLTSNLAAARRGTLGASSDILATTERERALKTQLGDIQARGLESAYQSAQSQFERDRAARMGAQQQNLAAALGVQQLGTQTGLQTALANLNTEQQARVQSEANRLQAQGMTQDAALRAALANQQAGLTVGQQNLAAALGIQQLGTQTGLQTALANLSSEQQANVQNLAAQLQTQGLNANQALQVALANQQAGMTAGSQNLAAQLGIQQLSAQQGLQAQQLNQAALQEAARQNLASALGVQQLGAQQSLAAQQANQQAAIQTAAQRLAAAQGLGGLAATTGQLGVAQQASDIDRLKTLGAYGDLERAYAQQQLDARLQDAMREIGYPEYQLSQMANLLRGVPLSESMYTTAQTAPPPSFASQLAGLGLSGLSLYNILGRTGG